MTTILTERAYAKLNLALHVCGQQTDKYHRLDSLVCFAAIGDDVALTDGPLSLSIDGPFAAELSVDDNHCLRAARFAGAEVTIKLTKNLPVASGIGGGSADAAAVLRGLRRMGHSIPSELSQLGADVPVCYRSIPARMQGIGDVLTPLPDLPHLSLLLVNPGIALSTPRVFDGLTRRDHAPLPPLPAFTCLNDLLDWLQQTRNDLQAAAISIAPAIAEVLHALDASGAVFARMSGSGATCFGIFGDPADANQAAARVKREGWWVAVTELAPIPKYD